MPKRVRASVGRREVRISLRTKDRATAKILVAQRALAMTKRFQDPEPWDRDAEERLESYQRGLTLIERYGLIDLGDTFAIDDLREWLTLEEFRDYVFAAEHKAALAAKTLAPPRASGSPDAIPTEHPQRPTQANQAPQRASAPSHVGDELIDRAIDRFVASKKLATTDATADKYGAQCRLFLKIIASGRTNLMISNITAKDLRTYVDTLPHLPARVDSADPRPLEQIMRGAGPTLSAKTVFSHAQATNMFLAWCEAQQYAVQSNFRSILKPLLKKPKVKNKTKAFSQQQLRALFETDSYQQGLFKRASDYWVPLLGLFTGAREAELCQLDVSDVRHDASTRLWLLHINADKDKRLKTDTSEREIPLHPQLIALGFLDFVDATRANNETRLFSDEQRNKRGEFSGFSKRFNRYKEAHGVKSDQHHKLDFHSFRHTLQTMLFAAGEEEYVVNALCGHSPAQRSEGVRTYSRGPGLEAKYELLLKLKFDIDFTQIKPNGWTLADDV